MFADSDSTNNTLVGFGAANIVLVDDIPVLEVALTMNWGEISCLK